MGILFPCACSEHFTDIVSISAKEFYHLVVLFCFVLVGAGAGAGAVSGLQ